MERNVYRILDANLNRAREALRVMEEFARFILDDRGLAERIKLLRHELASAAAGFDGMKLLAVRDIAADVGRETKTVAEMSRVDSRAVAVAAGKRLTEALRALEEYGKLAGPEEAAVFERIRYRAYELEQQVSLPRGGKQRRKQIEEANLHVLITSALCSNRDPVKTAEEVLAAGADVIQLREKEMTDRDLLDLAGRLAELCRQRGKLFIVNDRADIAALADADGVHLGRNDLPIQQARRIVGEERIIGASAHSIEEVKDAVAECADYIGIGAMFPSSTKPQVGVQGIKLAVKAKEVTDLPLVAIGGITPENSCELSAAGIHAVAVSSAIISSPDPASAVKKFLLHYGA
jgi:thiamine-phosphate pyrophosphorylase